MREITPYLYATEYQEPKMFSSFHSNAFFLKRESGDNFVIYNSSLLEFEEFFMREQGGVAKQYISHVHEANETCQWLQDEFENLTYCHEEDQIKLTQYCTVNGTYHSEIQVGTDFRIIPIGGHTPGSTCFYWEAPDGTRVMFTGDTLIPDQRGEWMMYMEDQSKDNEEVMLRGLDRLYEFEVDLVVPRGSEGQIEWLRSERREWHDILDKAIVRLRTKLLHISKRI